MNRQAQPPIDLSGLGDVIRRALFPVLGGDPSARGVVLDLRSLREFGIAPLRRQIALLGASSRPLLCGFYANSGDERLPSRLRTSPYLGRLTVRPLTELDWNLWLCGPDDFDMFERDMVFPDLVVAQSLTWMIWTEDNYSVLIPITGPALPTS